MWKGERGAVRDGAGRCPFYSLLALVRYITTCLPGTIIHTDIDDPSVPPPFPAPVRDDDSQMGGHVEVPSVLAKQGGPGSVPEPSKPRSDLAGMGRRDGGRHVAIECHMGVAGLWRGCGLCKWLGRDELEIGCGEPA